jgi:hypothetical protein
MSHPVATFTRGGWTPVEGSLSKLHVAAPGNERWYKFGLPGGAVRRGSVRVLFSGLSPHRIEIKE